VKRQEGSGNKLPAIAREIQAGSHYEANNINKAQVETVSSDQMTIPFHILYHRSN
jgi:hypothetical protein